MPHVSLCSLSWIAAHQGLSLVGAAVGHRCVEGHSVLGRGQGSRRIGQPSNLCDRLLCREKCTLQRARACTSIALSDHSFPTICNPSTPHVYLISQHVGPEFGVHAEQMSRLNSILHQQEREGVSPAAEIWRARCWWTRLVGVWLFSNSIAAGSCAPMPASTLMLKTAPVAALGAACIPTTSASDTAPQMRGIF